MKKLKNDKKVYIGSILLIVIVLITSSVLIGMKFTKSSTETTELLKNQTVESLEFSNATMSGNKLTVDVKNVSDISYNLETIDVKYLDASGNEIVTVNGYIGNSILEDSTKKLVVDTDADLSQAASIQYVIHK